MGLPNRARGTSNVRRVQDLKVMSDTQGVRDREDRPTFQQSHAVSMAVVDSAGGTLFRRPDTFDMVNPSGYFKPGII